MSQTELFQWIALAGGGVVVLALVYGIFRWSRQQDAIFPETAKQYGLVFTQEGRGSAFTNSKRSKHLRGIVPIDAILASFPLQRCTKVASFSRLI